MKRNLIGTLSLLALSLLLTTPGAYAQHAMQATVPFAFNVGSSRVPAGSYLITMDYHGDKIVVRNSSRTGATVLSHGQRESAGKISLKLVFKRFGDQYFLTQIWGEQGNAGEAVSVPRSATKLQVASAPTQSNKDVMIALK
jgi:hypothetical protein